MTDFVAKLRAEPVLVTQIVAAVLSLLAVFGLALPVATAGGVMAIAQVVAAVIARSQVTPVGPAPAPYIPEPAA